MRRADAGVDRPGDRRGRRAPITRGCIARASKEWESPRRSCSTPKRADNRREPVFSSMPTAGCWLNSAARASDGQVPAAISESLQPLADRPRPSARRGVAYLPLLPRCRLIIVGGGHVGQAVANLAAELDFEVWIIDDRASIRDARTRAARCATHHWRAGRRVANLGNYAEHVLPDRDARTQPRRRGALPLDRSRARLRRHDRQQTQDQVDLRRFAGRRDFTPGRSNRYMRQSDSTSAHRP